MTAIKKTTSKSTKSPAPATKTAAAPAKEAAKKKTTRARATTQPPVSVSAPPPAPAAPAATTPTIKAVATKPLTTTIVARIDVGFGNALHVRGDGPGLSWDEGILMNCIAPDHWELTLPESARPFAFKFLVNDLTWSTGADFTATPGQSVTLMPEF